MKKSKGLKKIYTNTAKISLALLLGGLFKSKKCHFLYSVNNLVGLNFFKFYKKYERKLLQCRRFYGIIHKLDMR